MMRDRHKTTPPSGDAPARDGDEVDEFDPDVDLDADIAEDDAADPEEPEDGKGGQPAGFARLRRLRRKKRPPRKRLSELLDEIGADEGRIRISVSDILQLMSGRAIGALLLIFALPNALPAPPGVSGILGLPLVYLSAQMMLGRMPWLPPFIANRSMSREDYLQTVSRVTPLLARAERLLKPRLSALVRHPAERIIGAVCLLLALVLILPIPFGNMLPAFAIVLIALGVLERDGLWVLGGLLVAVGAMSIVSGVVYAAIKTTIYLMLNAF